MAMMAKEHKVEPLRISFINALYLIQDELSGVMGEVRGRFRKS